MKRFISMAAACVMAFTAAAVPVVYAENLSGGIYSISDANFTLPMKTEIIFGSNTAEVIKNVMKIPDEYAKNSTLWHAVEEIKITFYIDRVNTPLSADFSGLFVQGVMQLGEGAGSAWADSDNNPGYVSITPARTDGYDLTQEYTLIFRPRAFMDLYNAGENGGAVLLGLKAGNMGNDSLSLGIRFTDMSIYGEPDIIASFRAKAVKETTAAPAGSLTGTPAAGTAKVTEPTAVSTAVTTTPAVTTETSVTTYAHTDYVSVPFSLDKSVTAAPKVTAATTPETKKSAAVTTNFTRPANQSAATETQREVSAENSPDTGISTTETLIAIGIFAVLAAAAAVLAAVMRKK
jgi:hypothetical protein